MTDWRSCENCSNDDCPWDHDGAACNRWEPMLFTPLRCKYCGGRLSEVRTNGTVPYRHCFSCHFEFPEEENNDKDTGPEDQAGAA